MAWHSIRNELVNSSVGQIKGIGFNDRFNEFWYA